MQKIRLAALFVAGLLTSACLPVTSKTPVGSTKGLGADVALVGTWKMKIQSSDSKTTSWAHFLPAKDGSLTILLAGSSMENGKADGDWMLFKGRTARLGDKSYLNVSTISSNGEPDKSRTTKDSFVFLYRATNAQTVTLYEGDEKKIAAAIAAKKIAGIVEKGDNGDVILTASAAELDKFFESKDGAALFATPYAVLTKAN